MAMLVRPIPPSEAKEELRAVYDQLKARYMIVPDFYRALGAAPHLVEAAARQTFFLEKTLGVAPRLRNLMAYVAVQEYSCSYCIGSTQMVLRLSGSTDREIASLKRESEAMEFDANTTALLSFVKLLVRASDRVTPEQIQRLRQAGYAEGDILKAAVVAASAGFNTRITGILNIQPEPVVAAANSAVGRRLLIPLMRMMMRREPAAQEEAPNPA